MFKKTIQGAVNVISCNESLTVANVEELQELAASMLGSGQPLTVLDMTSIKLIDSSGLNTLLNVKDEFESYGGQLKLAAPVPLCRDILRITGIEKEFEIFPRIADAIGSFVR